MLDQFPIVLANRSAGNTTKKVRTIQWVVPRQKFPIGIIVRIFPILQSRHAVENLFRIRLNASCGQ